MPRVFPLAHPQALKPATPVRSVETEHAPALRKVAVTTMRNVRKTRYKSNAQRCTPSPEYRDLFDPPALSTEAETLRRLVKRYWQYLRKIYGEGVPENEIEDFKDGFRDACAGRARKPLEACAGSSEGYYAGYQAGLRYLDQSAGDAGGERR